MSAIVVAPTPALSEVSSAVRTSALFQVAVNHRVDRPGRGQACERAGLKAYNMMTKSGT